MGTEDAIQMEIVPFDDPIGGYTVITTAMDVFSRKLFANCVTRIEARSVTRALTDTMTRPSNRPTTLITDKGI